MARRLEDYLSAVFLDIETTGIDPRYSDLTLIALYQEEEEKRARLYVNDLNGAVETLQYLDQKASEFGYDSINVCPLETFVEDAPLLTRVATFNGKQFDVPFIVHHLPAVGEAVRSWQHLDIYVQVAMPLRDRWILRTSNLKLKTLFQHLRIPRHPSVKQLRGEDAVALWRRWQYRYDSEALSTLALYALEDVRCTRLLLEKLIELRQGGR